MYGTVKQCVFVWAEQFGQMMSFYCLCAAFHSSGDNFPALKGLGRRMNMEEAPPVVLHLSPCKPTSVSCLRLTRTGESDGDEVRKYIRRAEGRTDTCRGEKKKSQGADSDLTQTHRSVTAPVRKKNVC